MEKIIITIENNGDATATHSECGCTETRGAWNIYMDDVKDESEEEFAESIRSDFNHERDCHVGHLERDDFDEDCGACVSNEDIYSRNDDRDNWY